MTNPIQNFMIVPAWFSDAIETDEVKRLLTLTFTGSERMATPENQFLYMDGIPKFRTACENALQSISPQIIIESQEENRGKGAGVVAGLQRGLQNPEIRWFVLRDADGDHRVEDFFALQELALQMEKECGDAPLMVVGGRIMLEPPLTLYRAVYERILNRCIDSAIRYALARENYVPDQTYYRQYGEVPDLQSGYKLYNRNAAEIILQSFAEIESTNKDVLRWGAEIVPYVSIVLHRGVIGEQRRSTYREQPVSAYASIKRAEFYARKLRWVFEHCGLSIWNAARLLDNELIYIPLMFDGMGRAELLAFRKAVLTPMRKREVDEVPPFRAGVNLL